MSSPNRGIVKQKGEAVPPFFFKTFQQGADGVLVLGCYPGDCHYSEGNYKAARRIPLLKQMLSQLGIEDERLRLDWVSASEGDGFVSVVNDMTAKVRELGPFAPLKRQISMLLSFIAST